MNSTAKLTRHLSKWKDYKDYYKRLFQLGLPILVTQVGIIVVNFADTMMVGHYGTNELAASAFVNSLFVIVTVMQMGFAAGLTPIIGALFGRGEHPNVGKNLRGALQVNIILSCTFTIIMGGLYFFLDLFGQPEEIMPLIRSYYLIILCTLLPMALFNTFQQMFNGITNTRTPMWFILIANVLNIIGNYILIFGHFGAPALGLIGGGLSTLFARCVAMIGIILYFAYRHDYRRYREGYALKEKLGEIRMRIWKTSYPVMIQSGVECFLWSFGAIVCGWYGKIQLAAFQVVTTVSQLGFMIYMSFTTAISILVANFTGRKDWIAVKRVTSAGLHVVLLLATFTSLLFIFAGKNIIIAFTPDAEVIASALGLLLPMVVYQYMDAVQLGYANAIRGTSFVLPLMYISVSCYLVIGISVMLWFAKIFEAENVGIYWSFCIALGIAAVLLFFTFRHIVRKQEALR